MMQVKKTGFYSTIQDTGRLGYRHMGVPVSGAMDQYAAHRANALLENENTAALLEITMTGPELGFSEPTFIALSGAEMPALLNGENIQANEVHQVKPGDTLSFGKLEHGFRTYLAIKGGFQTDLVLNSRSFYKPLTPLNRLKEGMEIPYIPESEFQPKITHVKTSPFWKENALQVYPGPEFHILGATQHERLFKGPFTIAKENNRMAYQLSETLEAGSYPMLTSATLPGTVQLTPSGKLIILMREGQTTGGYPRILQLSQKSMNLLAQKKYGDTVEFKLLP